jgi:flavin prenyltransferase
MKVVLAITGASGAIYGIRTLEELKKAGCRVYLTVSDNAKKIIEYETSYKIGDVEAIADRHFGENEISSELASGSFRYDCATIVPCSLKTMGAIASGYADNLIIARMAICALKEGHRIVIVPRETPFDLISLENMVKVKRSGAVILPAMPAFYHKPEKIDDIVNYVVGKILDQFGIEHELFKRWEG